VDAELRVVRINDYLAALNQQPVAAHLGHHIGDMIPDPQVRQQVLDDYRSAGQRPAADRHRAHRLPGLLARPAAPLGDQLPPAVRQRRPIIGITALLLDVTAHRQVEAELQRSRRLLARWSTISRP
jgi:hypothetical protein